uniref:ZP domain-containing protein n=1 Tax=Ditylenchus dipsaci TaxID=166011 RepID=A0A915DIQ8_9BILA
MEIIIFFAVSQVGRSIVLVPMDVAISPGDDLINTNVNVVVDPLRIIYNEPSYNMISNISRAKNTLKKDNLTFLSPLPSCILSIHKNECSGARILRTTKIAWDTRICFKWQCENATKFAMKVENCWTGSIQNPIFIINSNGCTNEETMISSPDYQPLQHTATAVGWLSVRLVGSEYIRLACAIRLCNLCDDPFCQLTTPPKCPPSTKRKVPVNKFMWDETYLDSTCNPFPPPTSTLLLLDQSSSANSTKAYLVKWVAYLISQNVAILLIVHVHIIK